MSLILLASPNTNTAYHNPSMETCRILREEISRYLRIAGSFTSSLRYSRLETSPRAFGSRPSTYNISATFLMLATNEPTPAWVWSPRRIEYSREGSCDFLQ